MLLDYVRFGSGLSSPLCSMVLLSHFLHTWLTVSLLALAAMEESGLPID